MSRLLVSVRSAAEAVTALDAGADLIDVKEPSNGPLGRADDGVIADVLRAVAGRRPVSAALGELAEAADPVPPGLDFVKWGLAGAGPAWAELLARAVDRLREHRPQPRAVAVAYADWRRAGTPPPEAVCAFAVRHRLGAFLVDTWGKDGSTLLDWLTETEVTRLCCRCRDADVRSALAGSLDAAAIARLRAVEPDWFAVRGAACLGGRRGEVDGARVRRLVALLQETPR